MDADAIPFDVTERRPLPPLPAARAVSETEAISDAVTKRIITLIREREAARVRPIYAAMMLARDLDTCRALLKGEAVPRQNLDARWLHLLSAWTD